MNDIDVFQMAEARDNRRDKQLDFIKNFNNPIISFTLNIPGPRKTSPLFKKIFCEGVLLIKEKFNDSIIQNREYTLPTGNEAYFSIKLPVESIKRIAVNIEDEHRLGRIFDIDVLDTEGFSISRRTLAMKPRKCLICSKEAVLCSRSRSHSVEDLLAKIESISRVF